MEAAMRARLLLVAVAGLSLAAVAAAEPAKAPVQKAAQPDNQRVEVVVASAAEVRPEMASATQDGAPVKRVRKARVNSCRCGDQPQGD
jgi:hypothetical protein